MQEMLLDEDSGAPDKFIPDEEVTPEIAKKLYYRCIRKNKSHNKASKPTQAQGLCGLSNCYVDAALGRLVREALEKAGRQDLIGVLK